MENIRATGNTLKILDRKGLKSIFKLILKYIKDKFDYLSIQSLSTEARQKLHKINPETIAQANRIPGISPSDVNILLVLLGR